MTQNQGSVWPIEKLSSISTVITKGTTPTSVGMAFTDAGIRFVKVESLQQGRINHSKCAWIDHATHRALGRSQLAEGDVLVSIAGTLGRTAVVRAEDLPANTNQAVALVRPTDRLDSSFAALALRIAAPRFVTAGGRGVGLQNLNLKQIGDVEIAVPPMAEQRRIVERIEALTQKSRRAKDALDAIPSLLERFRQSVLASAFRGDLTKDWRAQHPDVEPADKLLSRIRQERRHRWEQAELAKLKAKGKPPSDDRWKQKYEEPAPVDAEGLPELPGGWCWTSWDQIGLSQNGRAFPSDEYCDSGIKLLRPGNLHVSGEVRWPTKATQCLPEAWAQRYPDFIVGSEELIINLTAQSLKDQFLGRVCVTPLGDRSLLNQRLARLTPIGIAPRFAFWMFRSPSFRKYVDGLNTGSLIQHMFTTQLARAVVPLPPLAEQEALVSRLDRFHVSSELLASEQLASISRLADLDASILAKAFRGELTSNLPND